MKVNSISRKLLTRVLSLYFLLTFVVTCIQIGAEYFNTRNHIISELLTLEKTFSGSLTRAVWELNTQQALDIADGLVAIPMIKGVIVTDENDQIITQLGDTIDAKLYDRQEYAEQSSVNINSFSQGVFGHTFPLIFEFTGRTTRVGTVTLLSSNEVIFNRIEVGLYFLVANAMIKTLALILLFSLAFSKLLTTPLHEFTEQIKQFDIEDPESSKLSNINYEHNELDILETAYNNLIDELILYKEQLAIAQSEVVASNYKLDEHNLLLEQEVAKKASSLSTTMLDMKAQQNELLVQQKELQQENDRRRKTELTLTQTNKELRSSLIELDKAQVRLLESEKMATLGKVSAAVAHEIETPLSISSTSVSCLTDLLSNLNHDIGNKTLSKRALEGFTQQANNSVELIVNNITRATDLMDSFKRVAVDQSNDKVRLVNIGKYLDDVIHSLHPVLKRKNHTIKVNCLKGVEFYAHAGAISQIFTNLIMNSTIHAFENIQRGEIVIDVSIKDQLVRMQYQDNGCGLSPEALGKLFEQFYTTKENSGGSGLGTYIIKRLVTDSLNGTIVANSELGKGLVYVIEFYNMQ
jgi:signal transduction histidine kinase